MVLPKKNPTKPAYYSRNIIMNMYTGMLTLTFDIQLPTEGSFVGLAKRLHALFPGASIALLSPVAIK